MLNVFLAIDGSIATKQDNDNRPNVLFLILVENRAMRIHKVILLPVSTDVEIWNIFIEDGLIVYHYLVLGQFPFLVYVFDVDAMV